MSGTDDPPLPARPGADLQAAELSTGELIIADPSAPDEPATDAWLLGDAVEPEDLREDTDP